MVDCVKVAILGAGQIGRAAYKIINTLKDTSRIYNKVEVFVVDSNQDNIAELGPGSHHVVDLSSSSQEDIVRLLFAEKVTHVINALPFFLNEKIAMAAFNSACHYIDFTEDDKMADLVQDIYDGSDLTCAVKCGLAPGFVNYIGYNLAGKLDKTESLLVGVGALPRTVLYDYNHPELTYNLTWSVDGLVNEYIRPCRIRRNGAEVEVQPLNSVIKILLDGTEYEAAHTSGGIGSLVKDLVHVPNVCYMTLRYPGHYKYVRSVLHETHSKFDAMKEVFLEKFPITDDDVIVVYANAMGKNKNGRFSRLSYSRKFYGVNGMTGIQATTAGSGVAMLEMMLTNQVSGNVNHSSVNLDEFTYTDAFRMCYSTQHEKG